MSHTKTLFAAISMVWIVATDARAGELQRWSEKAANDWYARQPWLVGADYTPADAINQLEMWQAETFSPERIDMELGWAEGLGMNTMRVFLHDLPLAAGRRGVPEAARYVPRHRGET